MLKQSHATIRWFVIILAAVAIGAFALVKSPASAAGDPDLIISIDNNVPGDTSDDSFLPNGTGTVTVTVGNNVNTTNPATGTISMSLSLGGGLTFALAPGSTFPSTRSTGGAGIFTCTIDDADSMSCTNASVGDIPANPPATWEYMTADVIAPGTSGGPFTNTATVSGGGESDSSNNTATVSFFVSGPDLAIAISHQGAPSGSTNFAPGSNTGTVSTTITNVSGATVPGPTLVFIALQGGLTRIDSTTTSTPGNRFTCSGSQSVQCSANASFAPGESEVITFNVQAPATDPDPNILYRNFAFFINASDGNGGNNFNQDPVIFDIAGAPTATLVPTLGIPTPTVPPSPLPPTATFTPTLIPPPPTRTPLPRPANAGQAVPIPPSGVNVVVNRDGVNVRLLPAIGAELVGFVNAGTTFNNVEARSPDNEWVRVNLAGQQAWIGTAVITVLNGDIGALPVADPRTIPYGGFENPRAGLTSLTGTYTGRLEQSGLRLRAGPSQGYPVLANAPRYAELRLLGRTADNVWLQVNWEGTLGWVAAQFVALPEPGLALFDTLPVDGIVADALPISLPTQDSYTDTLRLLRDRLELAQPSLDEIRARWTTIALGEQTQCGNYPARPSDYNIPNTVLAPFYGTLNPLMTDFNLAMSHLRQAIDLLIESCQFAQPPEGLVGEGGAAVALQAVNDADALFSSLRARLNELIPSDEIPSEEQCLFTYQNQSEIVPRLRPSVVQFARLSQRNFVTGFCFDATVGASYRIELVRASGNIQPQASISSFNNPTNFLGVGRIGQGETYTAIAPILIPETGQYIVIVSDLTDTQRSGPLEGEFAILLTDLTGTSGVLAPGIAFDPNTGQVIVNPSPFNPIVPTAAVSTPGGPAPVVPATCPNVTYTCAQLLTCGEAQACLAAGNLSLDADGDGIACEENLCLQTGPTLTFTPRPTVSAKRD